MPKVSQEAEGRRVGEESLGTKAKALAKESCEGAAALHGAGGGRAAIRRPYLAARLPRRNTRLSLSRGEGRKSEEITGDNERVLCVYVCMCIRINMCVCVHRTRGKRKDTISEGRGMAQKKEGRSLRATIATFNF